MNGTYRIEIFAHPLAISADITSNPRNKEHVLLEHCLDTTINKPILETTRRIIRIMTSISDDQISKKSGHKVNNSIVRYAYEVLGTMNTLYSVVCYLPINLDG